MSNEVALRPEDFDLANAYLQYGTVKDTAEQLGIPEYVLVRTLDRSDVKEYINGIYLDRGYRNKHKLGEVLDKMIDAKLEEVEEKVEAMPLNEQDEEKSTAKGKGRPPKKKKKGKGE